MEPKHTPGPWTSSTPEGFEGFVYIDGQETKSGFVAVVYNTRDEERLANVRLLKTAPELLEALKGLLEHYVSLVESGDAGFWNPEKEAEVKASRSAIAKAIGEE